MKIKLLFTLLFLGACVAKVCAATDPSTAANGGFPSRVNTFSLAEDIYYYHYIEPNKAKKYSGVWNGLEGDYIFRPPQGNILNNPIVNFYSIEATYAQGKSDLIFNQTRFATGDGSSSKVKEKNIPGYMFEPRALIGRDFTPWSFLRLTPYVGFGVRYKTDKTAGHYNVLEDGTPIIGHDRSDLYYYIPTGLTIDLMANKDYEISLNGEYDYLIKGYQRDRFSDLDPFALIYSPTYYSNKALFAQDHGFGAKFYVKFLKHFSMVDVYFEPYLNYWHINASKATTIYETGSFSTSTSNKNSTVEVGSKVGVDF